MFEWLFNKMREFQQVYAFRKVLFRKVMFLTWRNQLAYSSREWVPDVTWVQPVVANIYCICLFPSDTCVISVQLYYSITDLWGYLVYSPLSYTDLMCIASARIASNFTVKLDLCCTTLMPSLLINTPLLTSKDRFVQTLAFYFKIVYTLRFYMHVIIIVLR